MTRTEKRKEAVKKVGKDLEKFLGLVGLAGLDAVIKSAAKTLDSDLNIDTSAKEIKVTSTVTDIPTYASAISAITNSDMFSSHQADAIKAVKKDKDRSYYEAVIDIAKNTSMFSSHRLEAIKGLE